MTHKTVILTDFDCYLASDDDSLEDRYEQRKMRDERLLHFPHAVMLQVAFPELDFINRWCWVHFGTRNGDCTQKYSRYRVCVVEELHSHSGVWTDHWFVKTDYDFGFNEWYFAIDEDRKAFLQNVPNFNWGENFPK